MLESWQHAREAAASCGGCPCVSRITRSKGRRHATDGRENGNADSGLGEEDTSGAVSRPAVHVRAVWWGLWALVISALLSTPAYAVTTDILINGNTYLYPNGSPNHGQTGLGYMVVADDAYTAALAVLGKDGSSLTADQKALLSNESTGGAFYTFVESFKNLNQAPSPAWSSPEFTSGAGLTFGKGNVWIVTTNEGDIASAKEDYEVIEDGGTLGGGGGGPEIVGEFYQITSPTRFYPASGNNRNYILSNDVRYTNTTGKISNQLWLNDVLTLKVNKVLIDNAVENYTNRNPDVNINGFSLGVTYSNGYVTTLYIYVNPSNIVYKTENIVFPQESIDKFGTTITYIEKVTCENYISISVTNTNTSFDGNNITVLNGSNNSIYSGGEVLLQATLLYFGVVAEFEPVIPPTNWPEPENPTTDPFTPEVPTPQNPTVPVQPTPPTNPTVDPPTIVQVPTFGPDPTGTDYTPYLIDILHELQDFETLFVSTMNSLFAELESHCYHLRMALHNEIGYLAQSISYSLNNEITSLANYLHELFEWLAAQLQSDVVNQYDDSSVIYWLRRIWLQLGGSEPKVIDDAEGTGNFWLDLLQKLLEMIYGTGSDLVGDVVGFFEGLKDIFPFSIPWDVAAILGLLVGAPVTPSFDMTITEPLSNGVMRFQGDLHWMDGAMANVRQMELIAFTIYLLWRTRDVLDLLKVG